MEVFTIAPAGTRPLWLFVPVALIVVAVFAVLAVSIWGSRAATFEVSPTGLRLRGDFYGRAVPIEHIRVDEVRRVDLSAGGELRPTLRTWGTGLPGYQSGWFRLANGDRALLYLTDRTRAIYVPTTDGYSLLLSPTDPDAFMAALRAASSSHRP